MRSAALIVRLTSLSMSLVWGVKLILRAWLPIACVPDGDWALLVVAFVYVLFKSALCPFAVPVHDGDWRSSVAAMHVFAVCCRALAIHSSFWQVPLDDVVSLLVRELLRPSFRHFLFGCLSLFLAVERRGDVG